MVEETVVKPTSIEELRPKMKLQGTVTRTEIYGAFVDIGLEQKGMIHISQLSSKRVSKVTDKVKPGDKVTVWVTSVDPVQGRIGLTMIEPPAVEWSELSEGQIVKGKVVRLERFGAFVDLGAERPALLHVREMGPYVKDPSEEVHVGQEIEVKILRLDPQKKQIDVTMNLEDASATVELEDEGPTMSPIEYALRKAQEQRAEKKREVQRVKKAGKQQAQLDEVYRRTLGQQ